MFPFEIDTTTDVPLWVQLRQRLIYLINSGYFKPGDQLPTVRGLAAEISINYNTVNKAYLSLASEGYLESTRGRGVFVRDVDAEVDEEYTSEIDGIMGDCVAACRDLGLSLDDIQKCMERKLKRVRMTESNCSTDAGRRSFGGTEATSGSDGAIIVEIDRRVQQRISQAGA